MCTVLSIGISVPRCQAEFHFFKESDSLFSNFHHPILEIIRHNLSRHFDLKEASAASTEKSSARSCERQCFPCRPEGRKDLASWNPCLFLMAAPLMIQLEDKAPQNILSKNQMLSFNLIPFWLSFFPLFSSHYSNPYCNSFPLFPLHLPPVLSLILWLHFVLWKFTTLAAHS